MFPDTSHCATLLSLLIAVFAHGPVSGADRDPLQIQLLDGAPAEGRLEAITADGHWQFRVHGERRSFSVNELLRLERTGSRSSEPAGSLIVFANGDRLAAEVVTGTEDDLQVQSLTLPKTQLSLLSVAGLIFGHTGVRTEYETERWMDRILSDRRSTDQLWLNNGDRLAGRLLKLSTQTIDLQTELGPQHISRQTCRALAFDSSLISLPDSLRPTLTVETSDGHWLHADRAGLSAEQLVLQGGIAGAISIPLDTLLSVTFLGARVRYLTDQPPVSQHATPLLGVSWPMRVGQCVTGGPLQLKGRRYHIGLGMHSHSQVTYELAGEDAQFQALIGVDTSSRGRGSVVMRVEVDGKEVFRSGILTGSSMPQTVSVPVGGGKRLTLAVDPADNVHVLDRANWILPRLTRP